MKECNESMIIRVKVGADEFATIDDCEHELDSNDYIPENEFWEDEDQVEFKDVYQTPCSLQLLFGWINLQMRLKSIDCF